ncbi:WhiB family transcriptional regulator [Catenulispora sp. GP43]|uniref:WhiB family transcriptional regulator n=1 Tax=Catenulispora sp. GP43 TaxID=3156263 RepID=UPI0035187FEF
MTVTPLRVLDEDPTRRLEWQEQAACRDYDSRLFFEPDHERPHARIRREQEAKKICAACPVQAECLRFAESGSGEFGVWGGTTQRERVSARRRRRRNGAPPPGRAKGVRRR